jgi:pyruvate dehydrogenase E2 component (dihydrolipoamide acetyltransferase)
MVEVVRIPTLGLSDYGDLVSWEVEIGESVSEGQILAVLESEKASAEIEASTSGILLETYVEAGEEIAIDVGKPLAVIGEEGEDAPTLREVEENDEGTTEEAPESESIDDVNSSQESPSTDEVKATPRAKRKAREENVDLSAFEGSGPQGAVTTDDIERGTEEQSSEPAEVKATPRAKRRAEADDIDLSSIEGTGPQDAITEEDIDKQLKETVQEPDGPSSSAEDLTIAESRELSGTRKTIAERLSQSAREKPHVMGTREVSIEQLERVRDRLDDSYDVHVSLNDLLLRLVGKVLGDLPEFNAHFEDGEHKLIDERNIGYAVDGQQGLVVPVIDEIDDRSLTELAEERRILVERVLNNNHSAEDLQGSTFTVTNVGVFGMDVSYSIINPPEVAILAVGRRKYAPVERDGDVEFEKVITFSLTIDHRVLDGADSGAFLDQLAEYIEYPGVVLDAI